MSVRASEPFDVVSLPIEELDSGSSVLVSGSDVDALASVFARLVAPTSREHSIVVGTDGVDEVVRTTDRLGGRAADDLTVLTESGSGPRRAGTIKSVDSISDLTQLGMSLSESVSDVNQAAGRFRSGVFLCSDICEAVNDIRSVYQFLNTRFLSDLRRHEAVGACAVDTDADVRTDMDSVVSSMASSFDFHLEIRNAGRREVTLSVSGEHRDMDRVTVSL
ncbi:MAG: hypothetical protein ABEI99_00330 [Halobaculum sp.]